MSSQYRKIKYEEEGPYGITNERYLYVWSHSTVGVTHVYDDTGEELFCYSGTGFEYSGGYSSMGQALSIIGTDWQNDRMEMMEKEEIELITNQNKDGEINTTT